MFRPVIFTGVKIDAQEGVQKPVAVVLEEGALLADTLHSEGVNSDRNRKSEKPKQHKIVENQKRKNSGSSESALELAQH